MVARYMIYNRGIFRDKFHWKFIDSEDNTIAKSAVSYRDIDKCLSDIALLNDRNNPVMYDFSPSFIG